MSRYIDADALIDAHYEYCTEHSNDESAVFYTWSKKLIDAASSIDICFCKDCKHRFVCCRGNIPLNGNGFCSDGKRRSDE